MKVNFRREPKRSLVRTGLQNLPGLPIQSLTRGAQGFCPLSLAPLRILSLTMIACFAPFTLETRTPGSSSRSRTFGYLGEVLP